MPSLQIYQYPRCSTCRKAIKWLDDQGIDYESIDIVENPPSKKKLKDAIRSSGLPIRKIFNTSGQSYRNGGFKEKLPEMSESEAVDALANDGKLIKRPLLVGDEKVMVGFRESEYEEAFR